MIRLLMTLLVLMVSSGYASAEIEIYAAGKHFNSLEDYRRSTQGLSAPVLKITPPQEAPKTVVLDPGQQKLTKMSYNSGVTRVMVNFEQNWNNPKPRFISGEDELAYTIQETLEHQHGPAILIADSKKMRILSYNSQTTSTPGKTDTLDKVLNK